MALPAPLKLSDVRQPGRHLRLRHYVQRRTLIGGRWGKQVIELDELLALGVANMILVGFAAVCTRILLREKTWRSTKRQDQRDLLKGSPLAL